MPTKRTVCTVCTGGMWSTPNAKCKPICRKCRDIRREVEHGTAHMYRNRKCRCGECKEWYRLNCFRIELCTQEKCGRPQLARGLCSVHYSDWYRAQRKYTIVCEACGETAQVERKRSKHCSYECGMKSVNAANAGMSVQQWLARPIPEPKLPELRQCEWCLQLHDGGHNGRAKHCSDDQCVIDRKQSKDKLKQIRKAQMRFRKSFNEGDYLAFLEELKLRTEIDVNQCWLWTGRLKDNYPIVRWGKSQRYVHRLALEAKHGQPLGTQAAHHKCANPACVNPDHLQPVTHRDNTAEMLQRHSYLNRIAELEEVVRELDSAHPVLNRIEVA